MRVVLQDRHRPRLEIIPFIDVMFFLLATFMIVSLSMTKNEAISIRLPQGTTTVTQNPNDQMIVTVLANGDYSVGKEKVPAADIAKRLAQLKAANPDPKVFVTGESDAPFERVIQVIDEGRKLGIGRIAIQTTKTKPTGSGAPAGNAPTAQSRPAPQQSQSTQPQHN
ncbi:Biopolymer transport protein ExbD [Methylacidimicrobium cyclopophantes]|uniref:Biopolymer transport protein ExbD n=1 Tax=Methylacidimicrobium cyclopophantes TaxID=1041766 RepID=A0A5E6MGE9_9BACT|nr:biopolymer transporter ExbD [Methylacidimicrobium cyclopophantes]VVM06943.1 Biopolymer transport protein ExbD [Methylacidimicrobium cyclopophantes]